MSAIIKNLEKRCNCENCSCEKCVHCGRKTAYKKIDPIEGRKHYVEGSGQLCPKCWTETYFT
jgi:hypothetical protein